jgi:hypothetical protein
MGAKFPADPHQPRQVRHGLEVVQVVIGVDAAVQADQGLGALGGVLGDIGGDRLGRQLGPILGDVADVELLAPAGQPLRLLLDRRIWHGHGDGGQPHGLGQQLGGEPLGWWRHVLRVVSRWCGVQADDGVEVDRAAGLVLGHLGVADPHQPLHLGLADAQQMSEGAVDGHAQGAPPQLGRQASRR